MDTFHPSSGNH